MFLTFFNIGDQPKEYRSDVDILFLPVLNGLLELA